MLSIMLICGEILQYIIIGQLEQTPLHKKKSVKNKQSNNLTFAKKNRQVVRKSGSSLVKFGDATVDLSHLIPIYQIYV